MRRNGAERGKYGPTLASNPGGTSTPANQKAVSATARQFYANRRYVVREVVRIFAEIRHRRAETDGQERPP